MKTQRILSFFLAALMIFSLLPVNILAAVDEDDRPNTLSRNLVIGILNDSRAAGSGAFPNEPSVTGYDYYYLQPNMTLSTSYMNNAHFSTQAENYININGFWNDSRIIMNAAGNAFG